MAAPVAGAVRLPAVRYGFALTGEPLGKLDITGTPEAGLEVDRFVAHFANWWKGRVRRKEREVGAQTLTRLDNGAVPILLVSFDYYANPGDAACSWPCWW